MDSLIIELCDKLNGLMNWLKTLPWSTIVVGIIVPFTSAYISYDLAESSIRRKENNRLNVYIEFVKKEIKNNELGFSELINLKREKDSTKAKLEFPAAFAKYLLIDILDELAKIKSNYFRFGDKLFEKPFILHILAQKIKDIEEQIEDESLKTYENEILRKEWLLNLANLEKEKEKLLKEFKKNHGRTVYKELESIYYNIDKATNNGKLLEIEGESSQLVTARQIFNILKDFVNIQDKTEKDVIALLDQIPLFSFDDGIVLNESFDQEEFDLYYRHGFSNSYQNDDSIFLVCEDYYKLQRLTTSISNYGLEWSNNKWQKYIDELVMINDKELYLDLNELNHRSFTITRNFLDSDIEEKEKIIEDNFSQIIDIVGRIVTRLQEKQEQIVRKIK